MQGFQRDRVTLDPGALPAASEDPAERTWREADALAVHFQRCTLWAMRAIHFLAVAMGLALLVYSDLGASAPDLMLWVFLGLFAVGLGIALWSQPGDWFRRPWSNPYNPTISKSLEQPAIYLLLDKPLAYIAPLLPPQSRFYQIADIALPIMPDGKFDQRIRTALQDPPPGGAWGLHT